MKEINPYIFDPSKKLIAWTPRTEKQYVDFVKRVYAMHERLGFKPPKESK